MRDTQRESNNKPNRTRRAIYIFGFTTIFAVAAFYVTLYGEGSIAETFVRGSIGLIELIAMAYLITTTVDRSEILSKLGNSMKKGVEEDDRAYRRNNRSRSRQRNRQRSDPYDEDMSADEDGAMG